MACFQANGDEWIGQPASISDGIKEPCDLFFCVSSISKLLWIFLHITKSGVTSSCDERLWMVLQFQHQFQDRGVEIQLHSVAVQFGRALRARVRVLKPRKGVKHHDVVSGNGTGQHVSSKTRGRFRMSWHGEGHLRSHAWCLIQKTLTSTIARQEMLAANPELLGLSPMEVRYRNNFASKNHPSLKIDDNKLRAFRAFWGYQVSQAIRGEFWLFDGDISKDAMLPPRYRHIGSCKWCAWNVIETQRYEWVSERFQNLSIM